MLFGSVLLLGILIGIPLLIYALAVHPFVRKLANQRRRLVVPQWSARY
jgi:hypothetical protein